MKPAKEGPAHNAYKECFLAYNSDYGAKVAAAISAHDYGADPNWDYEKEYPFDPPCGSEPDFYD